MYGLTIFSELGKGLTELAKLAEKFKMLPEEQLNKPLTPENCRIESISLRENKNRENFDQVVQNEFCGVQEIADEGGGKDSQNNENISEDVAEPPERSSNATPKIEGDDIEEHPSDIEQIPELANNADVIQTDKNENIQFSEVKENTSLDDTGKPYIKDGELIPNNTYEINGVKYETDDKGRIIHAETSVEINNEPRPSLNSRKVDGLEPGDDKGHIVAHILGGADTEGNLVAMDSKLNRGEYKSMELGAKRALEEGKEVIMTVDIEYEGDSKRPKSFTVTLEIDDEITVKKFLNNKNE